ncbi:MAG: Cna B-type domain-containing protein [Eubacterium sp.]|jgi:TQXA domain-containing protein
MQKKSKLLAVILGLCMIAGMIPAFPHAAFADGDTTGSVSYQVSWKDDSTVQLDVTPTNAGTVYYLVQEDGSDAPAESAVLSGNQLACTGGAATSAEIGEQSSETAKKVYVIYKEDSSDTYYNMSELRLPAKTETSETVASYGLSVGEYDPDFGTAAEGYSAVDPKTVTITNTGDSPMTIDVDGGAAYYTVSFDTDDRSIPAGGSVNMTVQPQTGLSEGTYDASISLLGTTSGATTAIQLEVPFKFAVSDNPEAQDPSVTVEAQRTGKDTAALKITATVDGTLRCIVTDSDASEPSDDDFANASSVEGNAGSTDVVYVSLGENPENAKTIYFRYYALSDGTLVGSGTQSIDIPAYGSTNFSATIDKTTLDLGTRLEGYSPANCAATATIENTGDGTLSFEVDTTDSGYADFAKYFTVNTSGASNIARGSKGSVTVMPVSGLTEGTYTGTFYLVDSDVTDTDGNSLKLGPVTVTMIVAKKGDSGAEDVRDPEGEYTPYRTEIQNALAIDSLYEMGIDGRTAYCANYNYTLWLSDDADMNYYYGSKFAEIADVTNKELDSYTGLDPNANPIVYPPNKNGYTPVKQGSSSSSVRDNVARVLYYGYPNDALNLRSSGDSVWNLNDDNNYVYCLENQGRKDYAFMIATQCAIWHYTDGIDFSDIKSGGDNDPRAQHIKEIYKTVPVWGWNDIQNLYNFLVGNDDDLLHTYLYGERGVFRNGVTYPSDLSDAPDDFVVDLFVADNPISLDGTPTWTQNLVAARTTTYEDKTETFAVTKVWSDNGNVTSVRPSTDEFKSWVRLYNGTDDVTETYKDSLTVVDNGDNTFTISYADLPVNGNEYTVGEVIPAEYEDIYKIPADAATVSNGGTLTNTLVTREENDASLTLRKTDMNGQVLDGAKFTLYADKECLNAITTLDAISADGGTASISTSASYLRPFLPETNGGITTVYLKETTAPTGYKATASSYPITIRTKIEEGWNSAETKYTIRTSYLIAWSHNDTLNVKNDTDTQEATEYDELTINKVDSNNQPLTGAVFTLYASEADANAETNAVKVIDMTSASTSTISTDDTALASYLPETTADTTTLYLKETTVPQGYTGETDLIEITLGKTENESWNADHTVYTKTTTYTITSDGSKTVSVTNTAENVTEVHSSLTINKTDSEGAALDGAKFTLYSDSDCQTAITAENAISADNGQAILNTSTLTGYLPAEDGTETHVYLKETTVPTGYSAPTDADGNDIVYDIVLGRSTADSVTTYTIKYNGSSKLVVANAPKTGSDTKETSLTVSKVGENEQALSGAVFSLFETRADAESGTDAVKTFDAVGTDGILTISTSDDYLSSYLPSVNEKTTLYLAETQAPDNYIKSDAVFPIDIETKQETAWNADHTQLITTTYHVISYRGSNAFTVPNFPTVDVTVNKEWNGATGDEVYVCLTKNGVVTGDPVKLTAPDWSTTFTDLLKFDSSGREINYGVVEYADADKTEVTNYSVTTHKNSDGTITVVNAPSDEVTSLTVTKDWKNGASGSVAVVELERKTSTDADFVSMGIALTLKASENWTGTFTDLPKYDSAGQAIEYRAVENAENYDSAVETEKNDDGTFSAVVTNKPSEETISIPVEKQFADGVSGEEITVVVKRDGKVVREHDLSESNDWHYTFEDLTKYAEDGHEYEYTVEETNKNYKPEVTLVDENDITQGVIITNYQSDEKITIPVVKKWNGTAADSVEIKLLANGEVVKTVEIDAEDGWKYTFSDLLKYDASGKEYEYSIEETAITGYTSDINGDAKNGFVVTNTQEGTHKGANRKPDNGSKPYTGDGSGMELWVMTSLIAGLLTVTLIRKRLTSK